ncbi:hypothetical protein EW145_g4040 [Phellinidium pouzarii]|uniref:Protein kinase domain-containing protein n=1 Tax=Phellinidium pouzarii TaxID=167371 RepID=A0A4S4L6T5_9AGAM|nr:hypothetical protein EW145_g4040 [Phellinidium pouzarii]
MSGEILTLLCLVYHKGDRPSISDLFSIKIANTELVDHLKEVIKEKMIKTFADIEAPKLRLWNVNIPAKDDVVFEKKFAAYIRNSHRPKKDTSPAKPLYRIFPKQPDEETLSIIIKEPSVYSEEEEEEHYKMFQHIILTVHKQGNFRRDDEALNGIATWTDELPAFVKIVEGNLNTKRDLPVRDKEALLREFDLSPNYEFGTSYSFTPLLEGERHGEELSELAHVMSSTGRHGGIEEWKQSLETAACSRFFFPVSNYMAKSLLRRQPDRKRIKFRFGSQSWLLSMLLKVKGEGNASYPYTPKSDFSKEAVIVVIYVTDEFKAHLHLFFEAEKGKVEDGPPRRETRSSHEAAEAAASENGPPAPTIFYTEEVFRLNHTPDQADPETVGTDRLRFISRLYNLFGWIDGSLLPEQLPNKYQKAIGVFKERNGTFRGGKGESNRGGTNLDLGGSGGSNHQGAGAGNGEGRRTEMSAFQADKYQLVDTRDPLLDELEHVYRVRRIGDESKTIYVAKRLREDLKELKILQALEMVERRCENIIRLVDTIESSVGKCIVLPKLMCVGTELSLGSDGGALRGRYIDLSRDLARGMTFLHDRNIAHLDVKPDNLVYTSEYRLQIIDFDTSVFVESEDEEMKGYIGSEGYMAPEIESRNGEVSYSPIKADRFSCGRVFKEFADVHDGDDEGLGLFASRLRLTDPCQRPQLREWCEPASRSEEGGNDSEGETLVSEAEESKVQMILEYVERPGKRHWDDMSIEAAGNPVY